eukprot:scaffold49762_cov63-Phaeocystis_antarctica.AAC.1
MGEVKRGSRAAGAPSRVRLRLLGALRGSSNTRFWGVEPLSHSPRCRDPSGATGADAVCSLGRYAPRFGRREGGSAVGAGESAGGCEAARGQGA